MQFGLHLDQTCAGLTTNTVASPITLAIIPLVALVVSRTSRLCIWVTPSPAFCGPMSTKTCAVVHV